MVVLTNSLGSTSNRCDRRLRHRLGLMRGRATTPQYEALVVHLARTWSAAARAARAQISLAIDSIVTRSVEAMKQATTRR